MIKQYTNQERDIVLKHIGDDRAMCFYLYMDLEECGCEDDGLGLWVSQDGDDIKFVIYKYYETVHLYGDVNDIDDEVIAKIKECEPRLLYGSVEVIEKLCDVFSVDKSEIERNHVITIDKFLSKDTDENNGISLATKEDIPTIAELMLKDEIYKKVYEYDKLCVELERRLESGFGRLFTIKRDGKILAANATYAETKDLGVIGGLITDPAARGQGLGAIITASTWDRVLRDGKQGLAFLEADNEKTINLHKKLGYIFLGVTARIILK